MKNAIAEFLLIGLGWALLFAADPDAKTAAITCFVGAIIVWSRP